MKCRACGSKNLSDPYKVIDGQNLQGFICKDCNAITIKSDSLRSEGPE